MKIKSKSIIKSLILLLIALFLFKSCKKEEIPTYKLYIRIINLSDVSIDTLNIIDEAPHLPVPVILFFYNNVKINDTTDYKMNENASKKIMFEAKINNKNYTAYWVHPYGLVYGEELRMVMPGGYYSFTIFECDTINYSLRLCLEDFRDL